MKWPTCSWSRAAAFEQYLAEGRAPTVELTRAFRAFKKWLLAIYKAVKNIMYTDADGSRYEVEINGDIRAVMDRMLASEEEIEASQEEKGGLRFSGAALREKNKKGNARKIYAFTS